MSEVMGLKHFFTKQRSKLMIGKQTNGPQVWSGDKTYQHLLKFIIKRKMIR